MGHKHAKQMAEYAADAQFYDKPWDLWEYRRHEGPGKGKWQRLHISPVWSTDTEYRRRPSRSQRDVEAFNEWYEKARDSGIFEIYPSDAWMAALEWERNKA